MANKPSILDIHKRTKPKSKSNTRSIGRGIDEDGRTTYRLPSTNTIASEVLDFETMSKAELAALRESEEMQNQVLDSLMNPVQTNYEEGGSQLDSIIERFGQTTQTQKSGYSNETFLRAMGRTPQQQQERQAQATEEYTDFETKRTKILQENLTHLGKFEQRDLRNVQDIATFAMRALEGDPAQIQQAQEILHTFKDYQPFKDLIAIQTNYTTSFDDLYQAPEGPNKFMSMVGWAFDKVLATQQATNKMILDIQDGNWGSLAARVGDFGLDFVQLVTPDGALRETLGAVGVPDVMGDLENWLEGKQSDVSKHDVNQDGRIDFRETFGIPADWANDWKIPLPVLSAFSVGNIVDFVGEVVTDPISWATMGAGGAGKGAIKAGNAAIHGILGASRTGGTLTKVIESVGAASIGKGAAVKLGDEGLEFVYKGMQNALDNRVPWNKFKTDIAEQYGKEFGKELGDTVADEMLEVAFKRAPFQTMLSKEQQLFKKLGGENLSPARKAKLEGKLARVRNELGDTDLAVDAVDKAAKRIKKNLTLVDRRLGGGLGFGAGRAVKYVPGSRSLYQYFKNNGLVATSSRKFFKGATTVNKVLGKNVSSLSHIDELLGEAHQLNWALDVLGDSGNETINVKQLMDLYANQAKSRSGREKLVQLTDPDTFEKTTVTEKVTGYVKNQKDDAGKTSSGNPRLFPLTDDPLSDAGYKGPRTKEGKPDRRTKEGKAFEEAQAEKFELSLDVTVPTTINETEAERLIEMLIDVGALAYGGKSNSGLDVFKLTRTEKKVSESVDIGTMSTTRIPPKPEAAIKSIEGYIDGIPIKDWERLNNTLDETIWSNAKTMDAWLDDPFTQLPPEGSNVYEVLEAVADRVEELEVQIVKKKKLIQEADPIKVGELQDELTNLYNIRNEFLLQAEMLHKGHDKWLNGLGKLESNSDALKVVDVEEVSNVPDFIWDLEKTTTVDNEGVLWVEPIPGSEPSTYLEGRGFNVEERIRWDDVKNASYSPNQYDMQGKFIGDAVPPKIPLTEQAETSLVSKRKESELLSNIKRQEINLNKANANVKAAQNKIDEHDLLASAEFGEDRAPLLRTLETAEEAATRSRESLFELKTRLQEFQEIGDIPLTTVGGLDTSSQEYENFMQYLLVKRPETVPSKYTIEAATEARQAGNFDKLRTGLTQEEWVERMYYEALEKVALLSTKGNKTYTARRIAGMKANKWYGVKLDADSKLSRLRSSDFEKYPDDIGQTGKIGDLLKKSQDMSKELQPEAITYEQMVERQRKWYEYKGKDSSALDKESLLLWDSGNVEWSTAGSGFARFTVGGFGPEDTASYYAKGYHKPVKYKTLPAVKSQRPIGTNPLTKENILSGEISDELAFDLRRANVDTMIDVLTIAKEQDLSPEALINMLENARLSNDLLDLPDGVSKALDTEILQTSKNSSVMGQPLGIDNLFGKERLYVYEQAAPQTTVAKNIKRVMKPYISVGGWTTKKLNNFRPYIAIADSGGEQQRDFIRHAASARQNATKAEHQVRIDVLQNTPDMIGDKIISNLKARNIEVPGKNKKAQRKEVRKYIGRIITELRKDYDNVIEDAEFFKNSYVAPTEKNPIKTFEQFENVRLDLVSSDESIENLKRITGFDDDIIDDLNNLVEQINVYAEEEKEIIAALVKGTKIENIDPEKYNPRLMSKDTQARLQKIFNGEANDDVTQDYLQMLENTDDIEKFIRRAGANNNLTDEEIQNMVDTFPNLFKAAKQNLDESAINVPAGLAPAVTTAQMQTKLLQAGHLSAREFLPEIQNVGAVNKIISDILDGIADHVGKVGADDFKERFVITKFYDVDPVDAWIRYSGEAHERRVIHDIVGDLEELELQDRLLPVKGEYGIRPAVVKGQLKTTIKKAKSAEGLNENQSLWRFEYTDLDGYQKKVDSVLEGQTQEQFMSTLTLEGFDGYVPLQAGDDFKLIHRDVFQELQENVIKPLSGDHLGGAFARNVNAFSTGWATWATVPLVGFSFHARNAIGNIFNMTLAGMKNPKHIMDATRLSWINSAVKKHMRISGIFDYEEALANLMADQGQKTLKSYGVRGKAGANLSITNTDLSHLVTMRDQGVVSAGFFADLDYSSGIDTVADIKNSAVRKYIDNPVTKFGKQTGSMIENNARMALYLDGIEKGLGPASAAQRVHQFLFDYTDLTATELKIKNYSRFYTWMRKNTALQARMLTSTPGSVLATQKLMVHLTEAIFGMDDDFQGKFVPEWAQDTGFLFNADDMFMARFETPLLSAMETVENMAWLMPITWVKPAIPDELEVPNMSGRIDAGLRLLASGPQSAVQGIVEMKMEQSLFTKAPMESDSASKIQHALGIAIPALPKLVREWAKWGGGDPLSIVPDHQEMKKFIGDDDFLKMRVMNFFFGGSTYGLNEEQQLRMIAAQRSNYDDIRNEWNKEKRELPTMDELVAEGVYREADRFIKTLLFSQDNVAALDQLATSNTWDILEEWGIPREATDRYDKTLQEHKDDVQVQIEIVEHKINEIIGQPNRKLTYDQKLYIAMGTPGGLSIGEYESMGIEPLRKNQFIEGATPEENMIRSEEWFEAIVEVAGLTPQEAKKLRPPLPNIIRYINDSLAVGTDLNEAVISFLEGYSRTKRAELGLPNDMYNFEKSQSPKQLKALTKKVAEATAEFYTIMRLYGINPAPGDAEHFIWYGVRPATSAQLTRLGLPLGQTVPNREDPRTEEQISMDDINTWEAIQKGLGNS